MPSPTFGVRGFVQLILVAIAFYNRHRDNIDDAVGPTVASALHIVADAEDAIAALNAFGPL